MPRTVGVEEELLLVDPASGRPRAVAATVLRRDRGGLSGELHAEQIETATEPCVDLADLDREIRARRAEAVTAARRAGVEAVALATSPLPTDPHVSADARYRAIVHRFGRTAGEQLTCACHVHVAVESDEEAVAVLDRIRVWLAPLLALSVNSPFWDGADSGYASFRNQVWGRWPSSGPTGAFGSAAGYREVAAALLATDTILDDGMLYFDARLSQRYPTVEIRVADVCRDPRDAVLVAALCRALVETAARDAQTDHPVPPVRTEVLRLAAWRAARSGLDDALLHPRTWRPAPAVDVVGGLIDAVTPALRDAGDLDTVRELWADLRTRRPGAHHQQRAFRRHDGDPLAVVHDALAARD